MSEEAEIKDHIAHFVAGRDLSTVLFRHVVRFIQEIFPFATRETVYSCVRSYLIEHGSMEVEEKDESLTAQGKKRRKPKKTEEEGSKKKEAIIAPIEEKMEEAQKEDAKPKKRSKKSSKKKTDSMTETQEKAEKKPRKSRYVRLHPSLRALCDGEEVVRYTDILGYLWKYVKSEELQSEKDRSMVRVDEKMAKVYGAAGEMNMRGALKGLSEHYEMLPVDFEKPDDPMEQREKLVAAKSDKSDAKKGDDISIPPPAMQRQTGEQEMKKRNRPMDDHKDDDDDDDDTDAGDQSQSSIPKPPKSRKKSKDGEAKKHSHSHHHEHQLSQDDENKEEDKEMTIPLSKELQNELRIKSSSARLSKVLSKLRDHAKKKGISHGKHVVVNGWFANLFPGHSVIRDGAELRWKSIREILKEKD
eukprot:TRINITY_DN203_c4_g1_i1.p1 TRINITY_DN203_c4_g1~~TRINITY_DN203_c4_g1_i1.p1  ORF type:complete len:415 (+),score=157.02 TRINITY_DN203_c4_g1_i1:114-1358(+)